MLTKIKNDETLCNLKLAQIYHEDDTGSKAICFVDSTNLTDAVVVFKGTGHHEWKDNFIAGYLSDSPQQKKALEWVNSLEYENITVSGHSKGGNKAQYVGYLSDKVDRCVSFDGQGFSEEFVEKYWVEIQKNVNKITSYSLDADFVNVLLYNIDIGERRQYVEGFGVDNFKQNHSPSSFFTPNNEGSLSLISSVQTKSMETLHDFTVFILNEATYTEKKLMFDLLGETTQKTFSSGGVEEAMQFVFLEKNQDALVTVFAYLIKFADEYDLSAEEVGQILQSFGLDAEISSDMYNKVKSVLDKATEEHWYLQVITNEKLVDYFGTPLWMMFNNPLREHEINMDYFSSFISKLYDEVITINVSSSDFDEVTVKHGVTRDFSPKYIDEIKLIANDIENASFISTKSWCNYTYINEDIFKFLINKALRYFGWVS